MKYTICILLILPFLLFSCGKSKNVDVISTDMEKIVTLNDKTLLRGEVEKVIPNGISAEDSASISQSYIDKWIKDILLYNKAKQNVIDQSEIDKLVNDYRKSLILNFYQEHLFKEYLSQSVSQKELQAYYEENKTQFKLKEEIIQGLYLKIPVESPQLGNFKKWYSQTSDAAIENIEKNYLQDAVAYEYFYDKWVNFSEIIDKMPYVATSNEQFLKSNKTLEVSDSTFVYLLNIKSYKLIGDEAPYEYAKGYLTEIFKEKKKELLLQQIQKDLYDNAVSNDEIKFYKK